jgi:hypothetical protein
VTPYVTEVLQKLVSPVRLTFSVVEKNMGNQNGNNCLLTEFGATKEYNEIFVIKV